MEKPRRQTAEALHAAEPHQRQTAAQQPTAILGAPVRQQTAAAQGTPEQQPPPAPSGAAESLR